MSPEVLEGAVNLRECESSLKQIDVYSLGLVLWEIAYRCHDLYPTKEAPHYLLPFEEETGENQTVSDNVLLIERIHFEVYLLCGNLIIVYIFIKNCSPFVIVFISMIKYARMNKNYPRPSFVVTVT